MRTRNTISLFCALAALPILTACTSAPAGSANTLAVGGTITLRPGERASLPDGSILRYVAITNDSRCPEKVQCVWAGDADLLFNLVDGDGPPREFHLHTGIEPRSFRVTGHNLSVDAVTRGSSARATIRLNP